MDHLAGLSGNFRASSISRLKPVQKRCHIRNPICRARSVLFAVGNLHGEKSGRAAGTKCVIAQKRVAASEPRGSKSGINVPAHGS